MFENDGCTWFPDGSWVRCCDVHDAAFATGTSWSEFISANLDLYACIAQHNWLAAAIALMGVMTGGGVLFVFGVKRKKIRPAIKVQGGS